MESYKEFKLRFLDTLYTPYKDLKKWSKGSHIDADYCDFYANYVCLYEAINSIQDDPHPWVKVAIDTMFTKWTNDLDEILKRAKENKSIGG